MIEQHLPSRISSVSGPMCNGCHVRDVGLCAELMRDETIETHKSYVSVRARRTFVHAYEVSSGVMILCEGWAVRYVQLPNGKRQVLSVVLPGEPVSASAMFERCVPFSVQAATDLRFYLMDKDIVRKRLMSSNAAFQRWTQIVAKEQGRADDQLADVAQRSAKERIAAFVLSIEDRLKVRSLTEAGSFSFPLRQQQVADLLGLTPVHVCRVATALRNDRILEFNRGTVRIVDHDELRKIAASRPS